MSAPGAERDAGGMTTTTARRGFLIGTPLAFAALLLLHPMGGDDFYELVAANVTRWLALHYAAALLFPLMGYVIWLLVRDLSGRAATIARIAVPVYAVCYGVGEAMMGIAAGVMAQQGNGMSGAQRQGVADAVNAIPTHPIVGDGMLFAFVGGLAWVVAVVAAIVALRRTGVRGAALVLLGVSALMALHVPPIGPVALVCLSGAALLIERRREALSPHALRPLVAS
jgi:hypothetical protein